MKKYNPPEGWRYMEYRSPTNSVQIQVWGGPGNLLKVVGLGDMREVPKTLDRLVAEHPDSHFNICRVRRVARLSRERE